MCNTIVKTLNNVSIVTNLLMLETDNSVSQYTVESTVSGAALYLTRPDVSCRASCGAFCGDDGDGGDDDGHDGHDDGRRGGHRGDHRDGEGARRELGIVPRNDMNN
jgi:hypothetical protein